MVGVYRAIVAICAVVALGCGDGQDDWMPGDEDNIRLVIAELSDARSNPEKLAELFFDGGLPDQTWLRNTAKQSFVVEKIDLQGDQAAVTIVFEDFFGAVVGRQTWKCGRAGEQWKILDAPLP